MSTGRYGTGMSRGDAESQPLRAEGATGSRRTWLPAASRSRLFLQSAGAQQVQDVMAGKRARRSGGVTGFAPLPVLRLVPGHRLGVAVRLWWVRTSRGWSGRCGGRAAGRVEQV
jgi:hypothetical protein